MPKLFNSLFQKKNPKDIGKQEPKQNLTNANQGQSSDINKVERPGNLRELKKQYSVNKNKKRKYRRTSESLANDPIYIATLLGLDKGRFDRPSDDTEYRVYHYHRPNTNLYTKQDNEVYIANIPQSPAFNRRTTIESNEPFPYKTYTDPVPRRSTLYHGVGYDGQPTVEENLRHSPKNQSYDYIRPSAAYINSPSTSTEQFKNSTQHRQSQGRRVTIQLPNSDDRNTKNLQTFEMDDENYVELQRKPTVVRLRPHSSINCGPRESVKLMVLRADQAEHPPLTLGKYVKQYPFQSPTHTKPLPVFMTPDGKLLKPLETETTRRFSVAQGTVDKVRPSTVNRTSVHYNAAYEDRPSMIESSVRCSAERPHEVDFDNPSNTTEAPLVYTSVPLVPVMASRSRSDSSDRRSVNTPQKLQRRNTPQPRRCTRYLVGSGMHHGTEQRKQHQRKIIRESKPSVLVCEVNRPSALTDYERRNSTRYVSVAKNVGNNQVDQEYDLKQIYDAEENSQLIGSEGIEPDTNFTTQFNRNSINTYQGNNVNQYLSPRDLKESRRLSKSKTLFNQPVVYAAQLDSTIPALGKWNSSGGKPSLGHVYITNKDYCGLTCDQYEVSEPNRLHTCHFDTPLMVTTEQQTDETDDEMDVLCYPTDIKMEGSYKNVIPKSDSKLKWRIIIKKDK